MVSLLASEGIESEDFFDEHVQVLKLVDVVVVNRCLNGIIRTLSLPSGHWVAQSC